MLRRFCGPLTCEFCRALQVTHGIPSDLLVVLGASQVVDV